MAPTVWKHRIGDQLHCPEFLGFIGDDIRIPMENSGPIVVTVRVGRQGQNQPVNLAGSHADRQSVSLGCSGKIHDSGADIAVKIAIQRLVDIRRRIVE